MPEYLETLQGQLIAPLDLMLKITAPKGFNVFGSNRFARLHQWLSNPLRAGDIPGSFAYPIKGQVLPRVRQVLFVRIEIKTNRWWPQGMYQVQEDGTFSGTVFLDRRLAEATFRFDVLDEDQALLQRFDVPVR